MDHILRACIAKVMIGFATAVYTPNPDKMKIAIGSENWAFGIATHFAKSIKKWRGEETLPRLCFGSVLIDELYAITGFPITI